MDVLFAAFHPRYRGVAQIVQPRDAGTLQAPGNYIGCTAPDVQRIVRLEGGAVDDGVPLETEHHITIPSGAGMHGSYLIPWGQIAIFLKGVRRRFAHLVVGMTEVGGRQPCPRIGQVRALGCAGLHLILEVRINDGLHVLAPHAHGQIVLADDLLQLTVHIRQIAGTEMIHARDILNVFGLLARKELQRQRQRGISGTAGDPVAASSTSAHGSPLLCMRKPGMKGGVTLDITSAFRRHIAKEDDFLRMKTAHHLRIAIQKKCPCLGSLLRAHR